MARRKKQSPGEIVAKLRQVEVSTSQRTPVADADRSIGVTEATYHRWRHEFGGLKLDQVRRLKELEAENKDWIGVVGAKTIEKSSAWKNGYVESFNNKLRNELLNIEILNSLRELQILIENWRRHHNTIRPHSALGYRPPAPEITVPAPPRDRLRNPDHLRRPRFRWSHGRRRTNILPGSHGGGLVVGHP